MIIYGTASNDRSSAELIGNMPNGRVEGYKDAPHPAYTTAPDLFIRDVYNLLLSLDAGPGVGVNEAGDGVNGPDDGVNEANDGKTSGAASIHG